MKHISKLLAQSFFPSEQSRLGLIKVYYRLIINLNKDIASLIVKRCYIECYNDWDWIK